MMGWLVMLAFLLSSAICTAEKYDSCKQPSITWSSEDFDRFEDIKHAKPTINIVMNVTSFLQCWETCRTSDSCNYFTWNQEDHSYFRNTCILFPEVTEEVECENCVSAAATCFCSSPFACKDTGKNLLLTGAGQLRETYSGFYVMENTYYKAQVLCNQWSDCTNFTCFASDHKYSKFCSFYSECPEVDDTCAGCCSGTKTLDPCTEYKELTSKERNVNSTSEKDHEDYDYSGSGRYYGKNYVTMPDWKDKGWYRFTGEAGEKMAESFPGYKKCGTTDPAYLLVNEEEENTLPSKGRSKAMRLCKSSRENNYECDTYPDHITVMNCGDYFVYDLPHQYMYVYCGAQ